MSLFGMCSDGLGVRVEDSLPMGQWFDSLLERIVLKTRAINSILRNRNMIGKIPTWWENVFRCMDHLVLRHPSYMRGFTYPFSLSVLFRQFLMNFNNSHHFNEDI
jgi:hypothetical protein